MRTGLHTIVGTITVPEGAPAFQDHRYETASAYDVLQPEPGEYEIRQYESDPAGTVVAVIPAVRRESYYESRLFHATQAQHRTGLQVPDEVHWQGYLFQVRPGVTMQGWVITPVEHRAVVPC